ncbi:YaaR family protein [Tepidibacter hydrothermalis]|uniref:YaaR family protein n=1 Tax=Tepidibacter hydrothermalis TaxID=3036126 RepID=A0ABY8EAS3_9FIRM|nr:YaaR family protein [Tepidibacter hydrothermalis]WFD10022.1 YaaR family protein [Tepidibacter hydrothermalis]
MVLNNVNPVNNINQISSVNKVNKSKEIKRAEFKAKFENIKSDKVKEHLTELYDKISEQSDKIGEKLYLKDLIQYKKLVKEFLNVAVNNSHSFSQQNFLDRRGRHRVYGIVKNVDRELSSLTKEFIGQEVDRLSVIKKLDGIKGMLVDVMM